jgi:hypothetical protein
MMRQPTPIANLLKWHRSALAGKNPPVHESEPQMGWFKTRMVRQGPYVPARIWVERDICPQTGELIDDERLLCEVDGERRDPDREWIWLSKYPISKTEYEHLIALRAALPDMAATHVPFDLTTTIMRP